MAIGSIECGTSVPITATTQIKVGQGALINIIVSSTTAGTFTVYDTATGTVVGKIIDTVTPPTSGASVTIRAAFAQGLYVVITGTLSIAVVYV